MTLLHEDHKEETPDTIISVLTKEKVTADVELHVQRDHMTYLEAIIHLCHETGIDPDDIAKLIVGPLRDKLEAEAQRNNILPKPNHLFGF
jgi:hypothetical protein